MLGTFTQEIVCLFYVAFGVGFDEVAMTTTGLEGTLGSASIRVGEDTVTVHFVAVELALVTLTG